MSNKCPSNVQVCSPFQTLPFIDLAGVSPNSSQGMLRAFIVSVKESSLKYQLNVSLRKV